jgi:Thioredoxin like C-terminal domain
MRVTLPILYGRRGEPCHATRAVWTCGRLSAARWKASRRGARNGGMDVGTDGIARFDRSGMIRLVAGAPRQRHVLTLSASDPGLRVYVFTFGP